MKSFSWTFTSAEIIFDYVLEDIFSLGSISSLNHCIRVPPTPLSLFVVANHPRMFQVFPLLITKFSYEEQADLVWQFICNIPVNMMAEFLPWLSSSVSPDEHQDILNCLHKIVPQEKLLQQVVTIMHLILNNQVCIFT